MNIISARTLAQMQISEGSLLPVKVRVHGAVQGSKLQILGGIFLHVADPREPDKRASTTQMLPPMSHPPTYPSPVSKHSGLLTRISLAWGRPPYQAFTLASPPLNARTLEW